jgi:hypothetical protein
MSTDAGSAAAPEDAATREVASERPGLESADPGSADSATSTPETADRGVEGSARPDADADAGSEEVGADSGADAVGADRGGSGDTGGNPADEGFVAGLLRDSTITGLPGDTGAPPAEPHAPQAQQQGDEPVGSEPRVSDENPRGVD